MIPVAYATSLGLLIDAMFGVGVVVGTLSGTVVVILYSLLGGFRAIVLSDMVQFFVMISSVILVFGFSIETYGGLDFLTKELPETHFSLTGGNSLATLFVWGLIALSTLVDPNFYQRIFAAKSVATAKKGIFISTVVWCIFDISVTGGAMYAAAALPNAESSTAYLSYAMGLLPDGLRGFFLAGILATILSTLDSYLFIASTTLVYDIFKTRKGLLFYHHAGTIFIGCLAALMSFVFEGNIKAIWKTFGSYSAGCLLLPMILGLLSKWRIKDTQFVLASLMGAFNITVWRWVPREGFWADVDDLYVGVLSTGFVIILSLMLNRRRSAQ